MVIAARRLFRESVSPRREDLFWKTLRLSNHTWKTTYSNRLNDLNAIMINHWRQSGFSPSRILDIGASSGVTSLELWKAVRAAGWQPEVIATDVSLDARLLIFFPFFRVLVPDGDDSKPLQYDLFGCGVRAYLGPRTFPISSLAISIYWLIRALGIKCRTEKLRLITPRARYCERLHFVQDDLFDETSKAELGRFDVVRVANILNLGYFSKEKIAQGIRNIKGVLQPDNSFLVAVRTLPDGTNHGSIFRLTGGKFHSVASIGSGSEIAELIANS